MFILWFDFLLKNIKSMHERVNIGFLCVCEERDAKQSFNITLGKFSGLRVLKVFLRL